MISIIIPVYNAAAKGLENCLKALADQTYKDIEVILVDDGSTDDSGRICDAWGEKDARFVVMHQLNQGTSAARNAGLMRAKGDEIAFVDNDDLPDKRLFEQLHDALLRCQADMSMARFSEVADSHMKLSGGCLTGQQMLMGLFDYYTQLYKNVFAKLYKRELLENVLFDNLRTADDVDFQSKVYPRVKLCAFVDQSLYIYNKCGDSIMHTQTARDYLDILKSYDGVVERLSKESSSLHGRALDALVRKLVSLRYRNRSIKDATLSERLCTMEKKYLPAYRKCDNGCWLVKMGLLVCLKMPWLHALVMDYRER